MQNVDVVLQVRQLESHSKHYPFVDPLKYYFDVHDVQSDVVEPPLQVTQELLQSTQVY